MTATDSRLYLFATIRPKPEFFDEARQALDGLIAPTLDEPGCHLFSAFVSRDEPGILHLFECFEDEDNLQRHYQTPHTKAVFDSYKDWLAAPVETVRLDAASAISAAQFARAAPT